MRDTRCFATSRIGLSRINAKFEGGIREEDANLRIDHAGELKISIFIDIYNHNYRYSINSLIVYAQLKQKSKGKFKKFD